MDYGPPLWAMWIVILLAVYGLCVGAWDLIRGIVWLCQHVVIQ